MSDFEVTVRVRWPRLNDGEAENVLGYVQGVLDSAIGSGVGAQLLCEAVEVKRPFLDHARRARFESLYEIARARASKGPLPETSKVNAWADEAGVGIISAPEAWFCDVVEIGLGRFAEKAWSFRHEHLDDPSVILAVFQSNGLEVDAWNWALFL